MENASRKTIIFLISSYQLLMPIISFIHLLIAPAIEKYTYFDSPFVDTTIRFFLWIYFAFGYWSAGMAIKNRISNKKGYYIEMQKDIFSFLQIGISGILLGAYLFLLTWWSISTFTPQLSEWVTIVFSGGNGIMLAALVFSQYHLLPDKD
ncbi:MAG TPA: hypothetical protein PLI75_15360 [Anaerolineales bacterium]|nr:hypothetical protein [Anaerolineales bacterium]